MAALCRAWVLSTGLYALCLAFRYQPEQHRLGRRQPKQVCNPTFGVGVISRLLIGQRNGAEFYRFTVFVLNRGVGDHVFSTDYRLPSLLATFGRARWPVALVCHHLRL